MGYRSTVAGSGVRLRRRLFRNKTGPTLRRLQPLHFAVLLAGKAGEVMGLLVTAGMGDALFHELMMRE
jgi:hypothetical protein